MGESKKLRRFHLSKQIHRLWKKLIIFILQLLRVFKVILYGIRIRYVFHYNYFLQIGVLSTFELDSKEISLAIIKLNTRTPIIPIIPITRKVALKIEP